MALGTKAEQLLLGYLGVTPRSGVGLLIAARQWAMSSVLRDI